MCSAGGVTFIHVPLNQALAHSYVRILRQEKGLFVCLFVLLKGFGTEGAGKKDLETKRQRKK